MTLKIDEFKENDVLILDLSGKIMLGEGNRVLHDRSCQLGYGKSHLRLRHRGQIAMPIDPQTGQEIDAWGRPVVNRNRRRAQFGGDDLPHQ